MAARRATKVTASRYSHVRRPTGMAAPLGHAVVSIYRIERVIEVTINGVMLLSGDPHEQAGAARVWTWRNDRFEF